MKVLNFAILGGHLGDAEVDDANLRQPVGRARWNQDVRRLEIAMDDVSTVRSLQCRGDQARQPQTFPSQSLFALELGGQRFTVDKLHRDVTATVVERSAAEQSHDARMIQRRNCLGFVQKPRRRLLVLRQVRVQHLDGRALTRFVVDSLEDRAHATFADDAHNAIASDDIIGFWHFVGHSKNRA